LLPAAVLAAANAGLEELDATGRFPGSLAP